MTQKKDAPASIPSGYDVTLLFPVLFLVGIGIVMIYSASSAIALKNFGNGYYFLKKQSMSALLGIAALAVCRHVPYRIYRYLSYVFLGMSMLFLMAVHISGFGVTAGGSTRWLQLGGVSFQPSEFARISMVIYLAYSMSKKKDFIRDFSIGFLPHVLVLGIFSMLIISQPDFGSVAILGALTWIMLYVGGARIVHLASATLVLLPFAYMFMISAAYRLRRLVSFLDPWQYPADEGYQIVHSLMAFGTGGIWGTGIGNG